MNKLNELIHKLCPNGVKYKKLADCCTLEKGNTPIQKAIPGEYPLVVTTEERKSCSTYQFEKPTVCIPLVSSRGHGVASLNSLYYQEGKFALGNILCGVTPLNSDELSAKFLFYYLTYKKDIVCPQYIYYQFLSQGIQKEIESKTRGAALKQINIEDLRQLLFPIPTLDVQQQIVSILNRFDVLCNDITSGLPAEIEARQKQYEYYRDKLLTFKEAGKC